MRDAGRVDRQMTEDDRKFLKECAALFRANDPKRAERLERIANVENA